MSEPDQRRRRGTLHFPERVPLFPNARYKLPVIQKNGRLEKPYDRGLSRAELPSVIK
jgi:hypothetical protein